MEDITDLLQVKIERARMALPEETQNAIAAVDWKAAIMGMRTKHGYTFEQLGDLETETDLLLSGLLDPENYPTELSNRMKISKKEADDVVKEMNDLVFKKIREELIKNAERKKMFQNNTATANPLKKFEPVRIQNIPITPITPRAQSAPQIIPPKEMGLEKVDAAVLNSAGIEIISKKEPSSEALSTIILPNREELLLKIQKPELIAKPSLNATLIGDEDRKKPGEAHPILAQKLSTSVKIPIVKTEHSLENMTKSVGTSSGAAKSLKIDPYREIPE